MVNKIKVLFVTDGLTSGGKERQLVEIIKHMDNRKFAIGVITYNTKQHYSEIVKENVEYFKEIDKKNKFSPFLKTFSCIKEFKPDILHTWDLLGDIYSFIPNKILNIKYVNGSIRDAGIEKGWQRKAKKYFLKHADVVLANSIAGLKAYGVNGEVIYNIINTDRFKGPYAGDKLNIIMVASFTPYKDYLTFIKAAALLLKESLVEIVYLVGDGPERKQCFEFIQVNFPQFISNFVFTGAVYNVEDYLGKCKIGVLCSTSKYSEGLSNSVLEYLASGVVPIVTNIGGSSEIITDDFNGVLVNEGSELEIYNKVKDLKCNPNKYSKLQKCGFETILQKFSVNSNLQKLEHLYIKVLNK